MEELELVVSEERLKDVPLETFYGLDNTPKAQIDFVAHFVQEDGKYLSKAKAVKKVLAGRTLRDVEELTTRLRSAMDEFAVPNE